MPMWLMMMKGREKFTREFCQDEHVQITCTRPHDVIVILEAKYGRMKIGKCVKGDYGGTGCVMDALFHLDHMCTGAQECRFRVFDATTLRERTACPEDVAAYIEVTYACVRALETESNECLVHKRITTQARATTSTLSTTTSTKHLNNNNNIINNNDDDDDRIYLSSVQTLKHNFASPSCPWLITTTRGQQITLYLRYVSPEYQESTDKYRKHNTDHQKYRHGNSLQNSNRFKTDFKPICYDLLTIEDIDQIITNRRMLTNIILPSTNNNINSIRHIPIPDHVTRVTTCHATGGEESELLKSKFSNVVVTTVAKQQLEGLGRFLLRYKAAYKLEEKCKKIAETRNQVLNLIPNVARTEAQKRTELKKRKSYEEKKER
ncbi:hypothetical protein HELRODRAFT_182196 [Helobdella robusta]|uniref:SUEL-type lectin domain-containing protein n=1 Tax=Helobdella robusta TaxID=6412 RepID=T1FHW8_HELRO|nr:hypothetical protein HELRODRAFT_182196 [Helobdella robusta]ESN91122.1 hypothetical protein HELRODRAFT_182196 [Helobdella robusta]